MKMWVDDLRPAPAGWAHARSYDEALLLLDRYGADITDVSLDHDLEPAHSDGDYTDGRTGYDVLEALLDRGLRPSIEFHTMNAAGMQRMQDLLESYE
jgi:hypothetical protein